MSSVTDEEWRTLLRIILSQRLEINALQSALRDAGILTAGQIKEIRIQASEAAKVWSSKESDDLLQLIRVHSSPGATMQVPPTSEEKASW